MLQDLLDDWWVFYQSHQPHLRATVGTQHGERIARLLVIIVSLAVIVPVQRRRYAVR